MAVFEKEGKSFAVPIGFESDGQYKIYSDEMFYVEDPHDLYKHWPADVWQSVQQHEVKPGMNELQADFAVGMGVPDAGASSDEKTVHYPNGGKPLVVTYRGGKAAEIKAGTPSFCRARLVFRKHFHHRGQWRQHKVIPRARIRHFGGSTSLPPALARLL